MVHNKTLKDYGCNNMSEYYAIIIASMTNGQRQQAGEQFLTLSKEQRKDFLTHLMDYTTEVTGIELSTLRYCISLIY